MIGPRRDDEGPPAGTERPFIPQIDFSLPVLITAHGPKAAPPALPGAVRAEQVHESAARQRLTMNMWAVAGLASIGLAAPPESFSRAPGQGFGVVGQVRPGFVRQVFPGPGDGHLDEHGRNGGDDGQSPGCRYAGAFFVVPAAHAENAPNRAMSARIMMAPAMVAAMLEMRMSRFCTWPISWASTPSIPPG